MKYKQIVLRLLIAPFGLINKIIQITNDGSRDIINKYKYPHTIIDKGCCISADSIINKHSRIFANCTINHSTIGNYTYIGRNSLIQHSNIGNYCSIANEVMCGLGRHPLNLLSTSPLFYKRNNPLKIKIIKKDSEFKEYLTINIGNDVWIGARAIILDGINIGNGAVIAAGAIVTKDIPAYAIVAGVPAKIIKYRSKQDNEDCWWEASPYVINQKYNNI